MKKLLGKHTLSFKKAFNGLFYAISTQPNFLFHMFAGVMVLLLAWVLRTTRVEIVVLILTITMVLTAEMINTAIESVTDLVTEEWHKKAEIAKDVSAGMVLLTAILSVVIGLLIFAPYILEFLHF